MVAITSVVVIPDKEKRKGTWMASGRMLPPMLTGDEGDVCSDCASVAAKNYGAVDKVHTRGV